MYSAGNITTCPIASEFGIKAAMGKAEQDPDLPCLASNVFSKVQSHPLFNEVAGQAKVAGQAELPAGQVNFRVSLLLSANTVLQPMLHPGIPSPVISIATRYNLS